MKPHVRRSVGDVITEIDVLTTPQDTSFDVFIARHASQIQQLVKEYRQQFRYCSFNFALDCRAVELGKLPNHFAFSSKICCCCCSCRSIRVYIRADAIFRREGENGDTMHVPAYFGTRPQDVNEVCDIVIDEITRELSSQVEH